MWPIFLFLTLLAVVTYGFAEDILVKLPNGQIRGREAKTYNNKTFYSFQKIPFASPPIGNLRFKAPVPAKNWEGILDASTDLNVACYQLEGDSEIESEDCLFINVYTPKLPRRGKNVSIPVLFYIYGGSFYWGHSFRSFYGPEYLIDHDIIVVTFNYRLGPFGFLSTLDTVIPGNAGLKDQELALKWTSENIHLFGGDPEKITINGESAGAACVAYHLLNPRLQGLFRGAILQSGTAINIWANQRRAREIAFKTGSTLNASFSDKNDSKALLEFLLKVPAKDLDQASLDVNNWAISDENRFEAISYAPVIEVDYEGASVTEKLYETIKAGKAIKVPIILGINSEEALWESVDPEGLKQKFANFDKNLDWLVNDGMQVADVEKRKQIGRTIREIYCGNGTFVDNLGGGIRYYSDNSFTRSIIKHAELQAKFSDVYFYQLSYDGPMGNFTVTLNGTERVAHAEDLWYIWAMVSKYYDNSDLRKFPTSDLINQRRMLKLWTDFVKTSNPTPKRSSLLQNILWPTVSSGKKGDFLYLDINRNLQVMHHPKKDTYAAWNRIYNCLDVDEFNTY